ncbi:MAG: hypothetical protein JJT88_15055 [Gammaproteobacteria bacterium]|nr:hypothetical protein [Gammaproteobacteria bacterium]
MPIVKRPLWLKRWLNRRTVGMVQRYVRWAGRRGLPSVRREGDRLGRIHYAFTPRYRRRLGRQIARLLGLQPGSPEVTGILRSAYRISDRAAFEVVALHAGVVSPDEAAASATVADVEPLAATLASGRGAVLLGMHMGNVYALLCALDRLRLPVSVIAYQSNKLPDGFFEQMVAGTDIETIPARPERAAFYGLSKAVKRGRATFIPVDQIHKAGGVETEFLGKRVTMPGGPVALARKFRVPIFPVFLDAAEPQWCYRLGAPIELDGSSSLEEDVARMSSILDAFIRAHPHLWSWHQRRWHRYPFADDA